MSNQPPPENLNELLVTIERQRRIICDLLIKNEELRTRVMHTEHNAVEPPERKTRRQQPISCMAVRRTETISRPMRAPTMPGNESNLGTGFHPVDQEQRYA